MSKKRSQKTNKRMFIKINDKESIDRYLTKKILYISNRGIEDTDKIDIIQQLFKWYPDYTLSSSTIDMLIAVALNKRISKYINS